MIYFIEGLLFGLGLILPLGPQNLFIFSQGLNKNKSSLTASIITAGCSDTFLITIAVLGLTAIVIKISGLRMLIFVCGVCFLLYLAFKSWRKPVEDSPSASVPSLSITKTIIYTLGVSLLNPYALMDTILSIGTASTVFNGHHKLIFALGCITASWLWFGFIGFAGLKLGNLYLLRRYEGKISAIMMLLAALFLIYFFYIHS